jgi:hypothetical protein
MADRSQFTSSGGGSKLDRLRSAAIRIVEPEMWNLTLLRITSSFLIDPSHFYRPKLISSANNGTCLSSFGSFRFRSFTPVIKKFIPLSLSRMTLLLQQNAVTDFPRRLTVSIGFVKFKTAVPITSQSNHRFCIPSPLQTIDSKFFHNSKRLQLLTFEFCSQLQQITSKAFSGSDLTAIMIPASVKILCEECFESCTSVKSVTFESDSKLERIDFQQLRSHSLIQLRFMIISYR